MDSRLFYKSGHAVSYNVRPGVADVFAVATAEAKMCRRPKRGTPREATTPCVCCNSLAASCTPSLFPSACEHFWRPEVRSDPFGLIMALMARQNSDTRNMLDCPDIDLSPFHVEAFISEHRILSYKSNRLTCRQFFNVYSRLKLNAVHIMLQCCFTFFKPRTRNVSNDLALFIVPNTGSAVPIRLL